MVSEVFEWRSRPWEAYYSQLGEDPWIAEMSGGSGIVY